MMHNRSDQKAGQLALRSSDLLVEPPATGVGSYLGCQACQKTLKRLGPVALQSEDVLEWSMNPSMSYRFPDAQRQSVFARALLELSLGVAATNAP